MRVRERQGERERKKKVEKEGETPSILTETKETLLLSLASLSLSLSKPKHENRWNRAARTPACCRAARAPEIKKRKVARSSLPFSGFSWPDLAFRFFFFSSSLARVPAFYFTFARISQSFSSREKRTMIKSILSFVLLEFAFLSIK